MKDGQKQDVIKAVQNPDFLNYEVQKLVATRGSVVIDHCKTSSALSAANAAAKTLCALFCDTKEDEWLSVGIYSTGQYNVVSDIVYSFPVTVKNGVVKVVEGLKFDAATLSQMKASEDELVHEKSIALP